MLPFGAEGVKTAGSLLQRNWEPLLSCAFEERIGNRGDGGKWVCDPSKLLSQRTCLGYSIGSNEEFSFEEGIHSRLPHCEIHAFDHTSSGKKVPDFVSFHQWGLGHPTLEGASRDRDPAARDSPHFDSIAGFVRALNHSHRSIDILKIDCEGCELDLGVPYLLEAPVFIRQLLIEVHFPPELLKKKHMQLHNFFDALTRAGYFQFHKEANVEHGIFGGDGLGACEFSFLKLNLGLPLNNLTEGVTRKEAMEKLVMRPDVLWRRDSVIPSSQADQACVWIGFRSTTGAGAQMCTHESDKVIAPTIRKHGRWPDCNMLADGWPDGGGIYLDVGANIGACVLEVLLSTPATVVAFEPNPVNLFPLTSTLMKMDQSYRDRVYLFPIALGANGTEAIINTAVDNPGNSVVGTQVKDHKDQVFLPPVGIRVMRMDSLLSFSMKSRDLRIPIMKLDAQGFECNILRGMGALLREVTTIQMEMARKWLSAQPGCSEAVILDIAAKNGLRAYSKSDGKPLPQPLDLEVYDILLSRDEPQVVPLHAFSVWRAYTEVLGRAPDPKGAKDHLNFLFGGGTEPQLFEMLQMSEEARLRGTKPPTIHGMKLDLSTRERKVYSRNGEDGIITAIFDAVGTTDRFYVEFGVEDCSECNSRNLRNEEPAWTGLLMDGTHENEHINLHKHFIDVEGIRDLFAKYGVPHAFDLLSVDLDYNDWYVLRQLILPAREGDTSSAPYRPRVLIVEYNAAHLPGQDRVVKYNASYHWNKTDYFGASMTALNLLARAAGYTLIYAESQGVNLFFVADEMHPRHLFKSAGDEEALYRPPAYTGACGHKGHCKDILDRKYLKASDLLASLAKGSKA